MKTSELTGRTLDWAVAQCENIKTEFHNGAHWIVDSDVFGNKRCLVGDDGELYHPTRDWNIAGPIIEKMLYGPEHLALEHTNRANKDQRYVASLNHPAKFCFGSTLLTAVMRCYVSSKLGDEVDIPKELN